MRDLNYELKQICERNRDGSHATQHDRARVLDLIANQLQEMGFRQMVVAGLKPKHVEGLVERWKADGLAGPPEQLRRHRHTRLLREPDRLWRERVDDAEEHRRHEHRPTRAGALPAGRAAAA